MAPCRRTTSHISSNIRICATYREALCSAKNHGQEAVDDYMEFHDELDNFEEAYCGEWDSEEDFARHIVEECYDLERSMGDLARYFDYEAFGRELFMYNYSMSANNL